MAFGAIRRRPVLSACIAVFAIAALIEVASYGFIVVAGKNFFFPLALNDIAEETIPDEVKVTFSQGFGWEPDHPNDHGYRGPAKPVERAALAVFGDSYARGHATLEQSWPYLLERRLDRPVLNFGVGAYGPDQAYLRFEQRYVDPIKTPYALLVMMSGGMSRIMNRYRGFYVRGVEINYPKPMFRQRVDGGFELLLNPLASPEELARLGDPAFLEAVGEDDYWYRHFDRYGMNEFVGFPYAYHLAKAAPYYWRRWHDHVVTNRQSYQALYQLDEAAATLRYIVEQFIALAKERGTTPIFVMLPNRADMERYLETGSTSYASVLGELKTLDSSSIHDGLDFFLPSVGDGANADSFYAARGDDSLTPMAEQIVGDGMHDVLMSIDAEPGLLDREAMAAKLPD